MKLQVGNMLVPPKPPYTTQTTLEFDDEENREHSPAEQAYQRALDEHKKLYG